MQITLGSNPFVAIENYGTVEEPDIRVWLDQSFDPAHWELLKAAMRKLTEDE